MLATSVMPLTAQIIPEVIPMENAMQETEEEQVMILRHMNGHWYKANGFSRLDPSVEGSAEKVADFYRGNTLVFISPFTCDPTTPEVMGRRGL